MISKYGPAYTEIGQILMSNTETYGHEADWATDGLRAIAQAIAEHRGYVTNQHGYGPKLTSNEGDDEFRNEIFDMRTYCWCDGSTEGHEDACPPNFLHKPSGLSITWYKHAGRGITANVEWLTTKQWYSIVNECIESI